MQRLDVVFGPAKAKLELFTDLLKVASLQGLISHLTEIHISIVMAQFPLQHTQKHTRVNQVKRTFTCSGMCAGVCLSVASCTCYTLS